MHRVEQFLGHLTARVAPDELALVRRVLPPGARPLFSGMPVADQRHAIDVANRLLAVGWDDDDLLAAAFLHDAAKGRRLRLWHRVAGVLAQHLAPRLLTRLASSDQHSSRYAWHLYLHHAELSASAAQHAGCNPRTVAFIRGRSPEPDAAALAALRAADEMS